MRLCLLGLALAACSSPPGTALVFDLTADLSTTAHFYDQPYPSDLRLDANGHPDLRGYANPNANPILTGLIASAQQRNNWPVLPVAYLRFSGPIPNRNLDDIIPASADSPILLMDIDDNSPDRGRLYPTVAQAGIADDYLPINTLAVAARPGFVLAPKRRYAFVVRKTLTSPSLSVPPAFADLVAGNTPAGAQGAAAKTLFAPLFTTLGMLQIDPKEIAGATVFTTGDVVQETFDLSTALVAKYSVTITDLAIDVNGATQDGFCELVGKVTYPQFQTGKPPFDTGGLFDFSDGGLPAKQRDEDAPVRITLPFGEMPAGGFPLVVYFHGSGGTSASAVDRGPVLVAGGDFTPGKGPAYIQAKHGLADACSALPVNPERLPGASETAYLNLANLAAFRDTFRQGVIEQRLFIEALRTIQIPPSVAAGCAQVTLPAGETAFHFKSDKLVAQGQSMGGMYTNMISATEPRILASVPTGAGGYWSYFILQTQLIANANILLGALFNTDPPPTFVHPGLVLFEAAEEPADPLVYMPRVAHRPLANHPTRPIYEPVGLGDSYFPSVVYDAVALAYQHQEAGDIIWPTMQPALKLESLDGIKPYPVTQNLKSVDGVPYTGVIVQYAGDGFYDPHAIYTQLDSVKYQYGCFLESFIKTGVATVPAVQPLGSPCP